MITVDENGTPLNDVVASASVHEGHLAEATVGGIVATKHRRGKKRVKKLVPKRVIADKVTMMMACERNLRTQGLI